MNYKSLLSQLLFVLLITATAAAQTSVQTVDAAAAYNRTITERADKIVAPLHISDVAKTIRVRDIVADQYRNLNDIYTTRDAGIKSAKANTGQDAATLNSRLSNIQETT